MRCPETPLLNSRSLMLPALSLIQSPLRTHRSTCLGAGTEAALDPLQLLVFVFGFWRWQDRATGVRSLPTRQKHGREMPKTRVTAEFLPRHVVRLLERSTLTNLLVTSFYTVRGPRFRDYPPSIPSITAFYTPLSHRRYALARFLWRKRRHGEVGESVNARLSKSRSSQLYTHLTPLLSPFPPVPPFPEASFLTSHLTPLSFQVGGIQARAPRLTVPFFYTPQSILNLLTSIEVSSCLLFSYIATLNKYALSQSDKPSELELDAMSPLLSFDFLG